MCLWFLVSNSGSAGANVISQYSMAGILYFYILWKGLHKNTWSGKLEPHKDTSCQVQLWPMAIISSVTVLARIYDDILYFCIIIFCIVILSESNRSAVV